MNHLLKRLTIPLFSLASSLAMASPQFLITHNTTDSESNAYISGTIPSIHPTKAHSDNKIAWISVKMSCFGHVVENRCTALIKMDTNTANPLELGVVTVDLSTGDIMPKQLTGNGYTLVVNGPGETTLYKN